MRLGSAASWGLGERRRRRGVFGVWQEKKSENPFSNPFSIRCPIAVITGVPECSWGK